MADNNLEGARETVVQAQAVARNPDFRVDAVQVDVSAEESVKAAVAHAAKYLGRTDYTVNSAGVGRSMECVGFCLWLIAY